jgi:hypothetical protein
MKTFRTFKIGLLLSSFLITPFMMAPAVDSVEFDEDVSIGAFEIDRASGDLYVGTETQDVNSLAKLTSHADNQTEVTVTGLAIAGNPANTRTVSLLKLGYKGTTPRLVFTTEAEETDNDNGKKIHACQADGSNSTSSEALIDANGDEISDDGILALAVTNSFNAGDGENDAYIFAAVADGGTNWAATNRGINLSILTETEETGALEIELAGTTAVSVAADLEDDANDKGASHAIINNASIIANTKPVLVWDERLQTLYVGGQIKTGEADGDGAVSVLCGKIGDGIGFINSVASVAAFAESTRGVVYTRDSNDEATTDLATPSAEEPDITTTFLPNVCKVYNMGVMHTSTGFAYLIINGGSAETEVAGDLRNQVRCQPLVKNSDQENIIGTFAKKDTSTPDFRLQASEAGDLCTMDDTQAKVGGGANLPFEGDTTTTMQVVGDCVYIGAKVDNDENNEGGIFYSTPEFNEHGKIIRWSRWAKAVPNILGSSRTEGTVNNFAVNPRDGKVWVNSGESEEFITVSNWGSETGTNELATAVNAELSGGCTAIAVFDGTTYGVADEITARYALFGGHEKVVFTIPTRARDTDDYSLPETATTDFSGTKVFRTITLPSGAGCVTALGGTNHVETDSEEFFFLAGTTKGLYALATTENGGGATANENAEDEHIDTLDGTPPDDEDTNGEDGFFNNEVSWQPVTRITGHVVKIKTCEYATGILTRGIVNGVPRDTLWILHDDEESSETVSELSENAFKAAESGINATDSNLSLVNSIHDFAFIDGDEDVQVVLATNNGLYQSRIDGGIEEIEDQANAKWRKIDHRAGNTATDGQQYTGLFTKNKTNYQTSFVGIKNKTKNRDPYRRYNHKALTQFCSSEEDYADIDARLNEGNIIRSFPNNFNSNSITDLLELERILDFWTDGARRFMIGTDSNGNGGTGLYVLPYDVASTGWNVTNSPHQVTASELAGKRLHCLNMLPGGHLCVGHSEGITILGHNTGIPQP